MERVQSEQIHIQEAAASARHARAQAPIRYQRGLGVGAVAFGVLAIGASALGALAIGSLAIGALALRRGRVRTLTVDSLDVRRLHVGELIIDNGAPSPSNRR